MEYLANVTIIRVCSLSLGEGVADAPSPYVKVDVFGETCYTHVVEDCAACAFGHTFCFCKRMSEEEFASSDAEITIMHYRRFGLSHPLGRLIFGLKKVHSQTGHAVTVDWFPILKMERPDQTVGFAQVTITAYGEQDSVRSIFGTLDEEGTDNQVKSRVQTFPVVGKSQDMFQVYARIIKAENLKPDVSYYVEGCFQGCVLKTHTKEDRSGNLSWQEEFQFPFQMPCWDDSIALALKSSSSLSEAVENEVMLHLDDILTKELKPKWYNFYSFDPSSAQGALSAMVAGHKESEPSVFTGRMLIAAEVIRTEKPQGQVVPMPPVRDPPTTKCILWLDVYMVSFEGSQSPKEISVSVEIGNQKSDMLLSTQDLVDGSFHFSGNGSADKTSDDFELVPGVGRAQVGIELIEFDRSMNADMFVSFHACFESLLSSSWYRYAFLRLEANNVWDWNVKPTWHALSSVHSTTENEIGGFALISVNVGKTIDRPKQRPPRQVVDYATYKFTVKLYQALHLPLKPWSEGEGGTNPEIVFFFGPAVLRSSIANWTTNPTYFEVLESTVKIPIAEHLRPDILIFVLNNLVAGSDMHPDPAGPLAMARYSASEPGAVPNNWTKEPKWIELGPAPGGVPVKFGKLLVSFELEPLENTTKKSINPDIVDCRIDFYAMGIRLWDPTVLPEGSGAPKLLLNWRDKKKVTKDPVANSGLDYDYKERLSLNCKLPKNCLFPEWLTVQVLNDDGTEFKLAALANIPLTPFVPWITNEEAKTIPARLSLGSRSDWGANAHPILDECEDDQESLGDDDPQGGLTEVEIREKEVIKMERKLFSALGWDADDWQSANCRTLDCIEHVNLSDELLDGSNRPIEKGNIFDAILSEFEQNFSWPAAAEVGDGLDAHPDLACSLEEEWKDQLLPYSRAPLVIGTESGLPRQIGVLKYCLMLVDKTQEKAGDADLEDKKREWEKRIGEIEKTMKTGRDMAIRTYVLSANGLIPKSGSAEAETFVKTIADLADDHSAPETLRQQSMSPSYNMCHAFSGCVFPGNCTMKFVVTETARSDGLLGTESSPEAAIGETIVDLEDRWFLQKYQDMVKADVVPIESRKLYLTGSSFQKGHLRVWIEVMPDKLSKTRKIAKLQSTKAQLFQIRVVVWRTRGLENALEDGANPDIFIMAKHTLDSKEDLIEQTDTHLNCDDGRGTFNWRMLFEILYPCKDPTVLVRLVNDGYMDDDALGEVLFNLAADLKQASSSQGVVELERGWVRLTHAAFPGQIRCEMELEMKIFPMAEASDVPVGKGREEPNVDPFVDPDDPHLLKHRSFLANLAIVQGALALGSGLLAMGKWILIGKIAFVVITTCSSFVLGIIMVTKE